MKMTKNVALTTALTFVPEDQTEVREVITSMIAQLSKPRITSDEAKAKRREKTAEARASVVKAVAPILRAHLTTPMTAKALFEAAKGELPEDYTWNKVQAMLLREMRDEITITEAKGKPNVYQMKG